MLRRRKRREPTAELPEALRPPPEPPRQPKEVRRVDRSRRAAADVVGQTQGYCPPWAGVAYAPKRMRVPAPPRIMHRGRQLQPRVDFAPAGDQQFYDDPGTFPWRCVCRITNAFGRVGSGVLVGPRHILTASHCVAWSSSDLEMIEVHRAGTVTQAVAFNTVALAYTQIEGDAASSDVLDEDYAVLVTNERLGDRSEAKSCTLEGSPKAARASRNRGSAVARSAGFSRTIFPSGPTFRSTQVMASRSPLDTFSSCAWVMISLNPAASSVRRMCSGSAKLKGLSSTVDWTLAAESGR